MKNAIIALLALAIVGLIALVVVGTDQEIGQEQVATTTPEQVTQPLTISQVTEQQIVLSDNTVISINDFSDQIEVATSTVFGSSDKIKDANISPDQKYLAIAVGGAAHDFGWIYDVTMQELRPVVFQYGGGVALAPWVSATQAKFVVTTPEPATIEKVIDVTNVPEFPKAL